MFFKHSRFVSGLLYVFALVFFAGKLWAQTATIERVKETDRQMTCAQIHAESAEMEKVIASAKEAQTAGNKTVVAGTAGNVAAEVADRTGLFGRFGGVAGSLLGKTAAKTAADSTQQSGQQTSEAAAERGRQAGARKDSLASLFSNRGCKESDLTYDPTPSAIAANVALAAPAPQVQRTYEPSLSAEDPDAFFSGKMGGTFGKDVKEVLPSYKRVAIAGFRVAFVTKDSATAQVRASYMPGGADNSGARFTVNAALSGVDAATMQAVTDKAYANFITQLKLAGREVVPQEELKEFYSGIQPTISTVEKPFSKDVGVQSLQIFAPSSMPLWFIHMESAMSDRGGFDLGNWRRIGEYSKKLNAIVVSPLIVVNFVSLQSSGNQSSLVSNTASAAALPGMAIRTFSSLYYSPVDEGAVQMKKGVTSDIVFGTLTEVAAEDNKAVKGIFDALGRAAGMANAGGANRGTSNRVMQASNAGYLVAAEDVLGRATGTFAKLFQKYPPP